MEQQRKKTIKVLKNQNKTPLNSNIRFWNGAGQSVLFQGKNRIYTGRLMVANQREDDFSLNGSPTIRSHTFPGPVRTGRPARNSGRTGWQARPCRAPFQGMRHGPSGIPGRPSKWYKRRLPTALPGRPRLR